MCNYQKPLIKWVGGKTQIIDEIISNFPTEIKDYHELFVGGGSVLIALLQKEQEKKIIINDIYAYDINETLINFYKNIQSHSKKVISNIEKIINIYNNINNNEINRKPKNIDEAKTSQESYYYWIRNEFNNMTQTKKNSIQGTVYFIFLNKTCFRGIYREGPNGFNVPFGHYKNPEIINKDHVEIISKLIKKVNFVHSNFENSFNNISKDDFVYLDPPYAPENTNSFVGYTYNGFNLEQHNLLFKLCKKYNFLMSNSDVELVRNSFNNKKKYKMKIISCKRSINSKKPDSKTNEVIIKSL
jgi:DNA adenine methylase